MENGKAGLRSRAKKFCVLCLDKMRAIWPIDLEREMHLVAVYLPLLEEVGEDRLAAGVDRMIKERPATTDDGFRLGFPTPSELRQYIPANRTILDRKEREAAEWRELHRKRAENPDDFVGEADVISMMRIVAEKVAKKEPVNSDEVWAEVLAIRHSIQDTHGAVRKPTTSAGSKSERNCMSHPSNV